MVVELLTEALVSTTVRMEGPPELSNCLIDFERRS